MNARKLLAAVMAAVFALGVATACGADFAEADHVHPEYEAHVADDTIHCDKADALDEVRSRIEHLKSDLETELTDEGREAIEEKIEAEQIRIACGQSVGSDDNPEEEGS